MKGKFKRIVSTVLALAMGIPPMLSFSTVQATNLANQNQTTITGDPVKTNFDNLELSLGRKNIDENWKFYKGDQSGAQAPEFDASNWENINLPHDYSINSEYTREGEAESGYKLGGIGWYRKSLQVGEDLKGKRFVVEFGGVYMNATVYINGKEVGTHPYGYSPFAFDLTNHIEFGKENVIAVKVNHQFPSSRWYSGSGIYRSVHLTISNQIHTERYGVSITTPKIDEQFDSKNIDTKLKTKVVNNGTSSKQVSVKQEIKLRGTEEVISTKTTESQTLEAGKTKEFVNEMTVSEVKMWSIEIQIFMKL